MGKKRVQESMVDISKFSCPHSSYKKMKGHILNFHYGKEAQQMTREVFHMRHVVIYFYSLRVYSFDVITWRVAHKRSSDMWRSRDTHSVEQHVNFTQKRILWVWQRSVIPKGSTRAHRTTASKDAVHTNLICPKDVELTMMFIWFFLIY